MAEEKQELRPGQEEPVEDFVEEAEDPLEEDEHCVTVQVANDHDKIKGMYRKFKDPSLSDDAHQRVVWEMVRALCVHLYAEEEVLCPVMAEAVGKRARDHAMDVDQSLKMLLGDIDSMRVGQAGFREKLEQLMQVFFEHMSEEEHLMPELREVVGDARLRELGGAFKAAKAHVPTRCV
ncbi:MAG: hypothetical protein J3K34DRAFT_403416 [Monoraphidium minutum]|nr:MAG: hypothetical protein J3K34DRAFT_403416 [Monoraphidium minutum]